MSSIAFDRAVSYYDDTRGFPPGEEKAVAALFAQAGGLTPDHHLLEIGIGTGRIALPLVGYVNRTTGIDLSRPMMDRLRAKRTGEPVDLVQGDATRLPFPAATFDAAVAVHVFHLIPNWPDALREVARVLRPSGVLLHGWNDNRRSKGEDVMWDAWDRAVWDKHNVPNVGIEHKEYETFLPDSGWRQVGETFSHPYFIERIPRRFIELMDQRIWSSCWRLSDEAVAEGIAAVRAAMEKHNIPPDEPVRYQSAFHIQVYQPPTE